jgi:hypothetical protein
MDSSIKERKRKTGVSMTAVNDCAATVWVHFPSPDFENQV